jgi:hypothetical protein
MIRITHPWRLANISVGLRGVLSNRRRARLIRRMDRKLPVQRPAGDVQLD